MSADDVKDFTLSEGEIRTVARALRAYEESDELDEEIDEEVIRGVRERFESAFEQLQLE